MTARAIDEAIPGPCNATSHGERNRLMNMPTHAVAWPTLIPEEPIQEGPLAVYPLLRAGAPPAEPTYLLLEEALEAKLVEVTEIDQAGHVPTIALINNGVLPVLVVQGQELVGAKQNRTLNVTILAAPGRTEIPVTCVERGRWGYNAARFDSGNFEHYRLRRMKAEMVNASVKRNLSKKDRYSVDQMAVWEEVDLESARHDVSSATSALNEVYSSPRVAAKLRDFDKLKKLPKGTVGVAIAMGGELVAAEFLETPEAFAALWPNMLKGYGLSSIYADEKAAPERTHAQMFLTLPSNAEASVDEPVGLGQDVRWEGPEFLAGALAHEERLLHGTMFTRRPDKEAR